MLSKYKEYIQQYQKQEFEKQNNDIEYIGFLERVQNVIKSSDELLVKKCEKQLKALSSVTENMTVQKFKPLPGKDLEARNAYNELQQCAGEFMGISNGFKTLFGTAEYVIVYQVEQCIADVPTSNEETEKRGIRDCIDKTFKYTNKAFIKVVEDNLKIVEEKLKKL